MPNSLPPIYHDIVAHLLTRLDYIRIQPKTILNVDSHPEFTKEKLQALYPSANITDTANFLGKKNNDTYDLIIAHFALLRENPVDLLRAFSSVLNNEGLLLFTSLGPDTFCELRQ